MAEENNTAPEQQTAEIKIADIVMAANIIDLATQRGAFKAAEAAQVGGCFEKLVAFVKANTPEPEEGAKEGDSSKEG